MGRKTSCAPFRRTIVIGGKQTLPLQEEWPRQKSGMRDVFKTVNARRKDDDGKWWVAYWLRDGYMWATVIASAAAELDAAQETAAAKTAALTAVLAVKSVEPTCPVRAALRTWEARTGLAKKQVSALLRCDAGSLSRWRNGLLGEIEDARISQLVQRVSEPALALGVGPFIARVGSLTTFPE